MSLKVDTISVKNGEKYNRRECLDHTPFKRLVCVKQGPLQSMLPIKQWLYFFLIEFLMTNKVILSNGIFKEK